MNIVDRFLNNVTMYRLVVYVLSTLAGLGVLFAIIGRISLSPSELVISLFLLIASAYITDRMFGWIFNVPVNMESALITALILFLILQPAGSLSAALALVLAGGVSSASKFILAWNGKHIFNPAAFAGALLSLTGIHTSTWWIGSATLWPFSLILGLAVVRKIRKFSLFASFVAVSILMELALFLMNGQPLYTSLQPALISSPLIFLATIMLTEPATMPPRRKMQILFGALVAVLYVGGWSIGPLIMYPTVALLAGNAFAYMVSPKFRVKLQLAEIQKISDRVYNYVFQPDRAFSFLPGQYMEWTLPGVRYDGRGNRRTFTIASSPTESTIQLGVKFYEPASTYKARLHALKPGDTVYASQLAGNFTLNSNEHRKLAFIAGGIGITPFRSMIKYLTDQAIPVDIVLVYAVTDASEFTYQQELIDAAKVGVKTIPVVTSHGNELPGVVRSPLDIKLLQQYIPDYSDRVFYISGPNAMVSSTQKALRALHVAHRNIKTDHFSGY